MDGKRKLTIGIASALLIATAVIIVGVLSLDSGSGTTAPGVPADDAAAGDRTPDPEAIDTFTQTCGQCHTLTVAGTTADVGPNLDGIEYDRRRVLNAIERGGRGSGAMAPNLITGAEAERVAELIASDEPLH